MLIHFKTTVAGRLLQDSFLWPREEQDLLQIKFFAANLLTDTFGREFGALDPREIECKYSLSDFLVANLRRFQSNLAYSDQFSYATWLT